MADWTAPRFTRRTFIGWWMASLLTSIAVVAAAPILVYLWPAPPKGEKRGKIKITLDKSLSDLQSGDAIRFDAPKNPNSAFIMADGGGDNAAGDLAFSGYAVKDLESKLHYFAINCSHLGCSYTLNTTDKTFDCPCHGSRFHLDGTVLHGPASAPLSNLTVETDPSDPTTLQIEGIVLGF